jgi:hypothetical protein
VWVTALLKRVEARESLLGTRIVTAQHEPGPNTFFKPQLNDCPPCAESEKRNSPREVESHERHPLGP